MSNVQKWVEKCEAEGAEIICVESASEVTGLYMSKQKLGGNKFTEPVYHVWICDLNVFNCRNYRTAYNLYRERRYMGVSE